VSLKYVVDRAFRFFGPDWNQHVISDNSLLRPSDIRFGAGSAARDALQKTQSSGATSP
jgi:hypothetical protein